MVSNKNTIVGYIIGGIFALVILPSFVVSITYLLDQIYLVKFFINYTFSYVFGSLLLCIGIVFAISSLIVQNKIGKGGPLQGFDIEISPKTKNLVVSGPYKYSRNPMLFGSFCIYGSIAIFINSLNSLLPIAIIVICMVLIVVRNEEKRLLKDFGSEYEDYRRKTSMIIPFPAKRKKQDHE